MVITCCFCRGLVNLVLVIVFLNFILELLFLESGLYRFLFCLVWHLWSLVNKTCLMLLYSPPCMLFISRCGMPSAKELFLYRNWLFYTRVVLCPLRLEKERVAFPLHLGDRRTKQPGELVTKPSIFFHYARVDQRFYRWYLESSVFSY